MKRYLPATLAFTILLAGGVTMFEAVRMIEPGGLLSAAQQPPEVQAVEAANRAFEQAYARSDKAAVARLLDADFSWIDSGGVMNSRDEALANWPKPIVTSGESGAQTAARLYGRVVLLHIHRGNDYALRIWVHRPEGWRLLHVIEAAQPPSSARPKSLASAAAVPSEAGIDTPCINPCQVSPYHPQSADAKAAYQAWLRLEDGSLKRDMEEWGDQVLPDCIIVDSGGHGVITKAGRIAETLRQKSGGVRTNEVPPLVWAHEYDFGGTVVQLALHQSYIGPPFYATRVWVRRDGRYQMAASYHVGIRDVPSFTLSKQLAPR